MVRSRPSRKHPRAETTLNWSRIDSVAVSFPEHRTTLGWHRFRLNRQLGREREHGRWAQLAHLKKKGGVYAFLLPLAMFRDEHSRCLGKGIWLDFPAGSLRAVLPEPGRFVAYVGRTADLLNRIQLHIRGNSPSSSKLLDRMADALGHTGRRPIAKLKKGSRMRAIRPAKDRLLTHGILVYYVLDGKACTASRHCIEAALTGRYGPPFSIEVEH